MAEFKLGDLAFVSTIVSDELFTPSRPWSRRPDKPLDRAMPEHITVDGVAHPLKDYQVEQYGAEWWFAYFFDQAKQWLAKLKTAEKTALLALLNGAFVRPDSLRADAENARYLIPRGQLETVFAGRANVLQDGLKALLAAGFESIEQGPNGMKLSSEALRKYALNMDRKIDYKLVWRGGEREWANVRAYGYAAAARYEKDAKDWNMRQPWHPFDDVPTRSKVYYRKAFTDNCLFTVVSVTDDWRCAICYPKIEQTTALMKIQAAVKGGRTLAQLESEYPDRIARVSYASRQPEYRIVNVTRIALMVLEGIVFDTQQRQKDTRGPSDYYPEQGAESIVGSNVFAMAEYVRVFHGVEDKDGFTAFLRPSGSRLASQADLAAAFGSSRAVNEYYQQILTENSSAKVNRISLRWEATGVGAPPGPAIDYWREIKFGNGMTLLR